MKIERIRSRNISGLGSIDLKLPSEPVILLFNDPIRLRLFNNLLTELFYETANSQFSKKQSQEAVLEVWLSEGSHSFYISRQFNEQHIDNDSRNLVILDETERVISLPESLSLGEYLFRIKLNAFQQGAYVLWPEEKQSDFFLKCARNIVQGGDEGLSLTKVREAINGAQIKLKNQAESIGTIKIEYDELRNEWESASRQQEDHRLLLINIKNLEDKDKILADKILEETKLLERLSVLEDNPDYRELRMLKGELGRLQDDRHTADEALFNITQSTYVDWQLVQSLREECMEWAILQEEVRRISEDVNKYKLLIEQTDKFLKELSQNYSEEKVLYLKEVESKRFEAQNKLKRLQDFKSEINETKIQLDLETSRVQDFEDMAELPERVEETVVKKERYLRLWEHSLIGKLVDGILQEQLGRTSIRERVYQRFAKYYQYHKSANLQEFIVRLKNYAKQQQCVERLQLKLMEYQEEIKGEEQVLNLISSYEKILKQAFRSVNVSNYLDWQKGWLEYQQRKSNLDKDKEKLQHLLQQKVIKEQDLESSVNHLREKIGQWGMNVNERDQVLTVVLKVATQLKLKDEIQKEFETLTQKYNNLLGKRNMETLESNLEPLADLERETNLSQNIRHEKLKGWNEELIDVRRQIDKARLSLNSINMPPSLTLIENKLETLKQQLVSYDNLHRALYGAQTLLDESWMEWKSKYESRLLDEIQWIFQQFSVSDSNDLYEAQKKYFASRLAIAQLSLRQKPDVPMFFEVSEFNEEEPFWKEALKYLNKLTLFRQLIIYTSSNSILTEKTGWKKVLIL